MTEYHGGLLAARVFLDRWADSPEMRDYKAARKRRVIGMPALPIETALEAILTAAFDKGVEEETAERNGERT